KTILERPWAGGRRSCACGCLRPLAGSRRPRIGRWCSFARGRAGQVALRNRQICPRSARGGEVRADAAVAPQGCQGAPAAADFRGELVAADGVLRSVVRGRDVEAGREWPYLAGFAFQPPGSP